MNHQNFGFQQILDESDLLLYLQFSPKKECLKKFPKFYNKFFKLLLYLLKCLLEALFIFYDLFDRLINLVTDGLEDYVKYSLG
ncbi:unnamed protein product [Nezara viridula]|uniref:Uncharacterized protein n=1 Tax=Nezara viridula TaxID=85310 RepID=A0A9P0H3S7_NEZVI|nr:unnamed protein product [Nezara viridula]